MAGVERNRGGCLRTFLILVLTANALAALFLLNADDVFKYNLPSLPGLALEVYTVVSFANVVFALAIWKLKKWGMYGFIISTLVAVVVNVLSGVPIIPSLVGLGYIAILFFLLNRGDHPIWSQMD